MARHGFLGLVSLLFLALLAPLAAAQLQIYTGSDKYLYQGCFNETNDIANSTRERALSGGASRVLQGNMTVPLCLSFCSSGADKQYTYAGVEYSRECWCAQRISGLSVKLDDSECNLPCDGNQGMVCGGALKLSVYKLTADARLAATATSWGAVLAAALVTYVVL
ncbi:putative fungistatic metabolite [Colletotrichum spaethianum]|uniref:Fungistatic metabolite n=1 Tax=Colletotrichum spaethianum TaxID=700344 RepID=A0AA37P754_9PEZI|nr:putative fungistatic metabolite [Colletotrichum spaethianum]GKT42124.1 putative fungistatic metabolite [Colletotrichum spaethianum]